MTYNKLLKIVSSAFKNYEKGLDKLRVNTITQLHEDLEQAFPSYNQAQEPSTEIEDSGKKIRST